MEAQTVTLYSATQAHSVLGDLWKSIKPMLLSGHRMVITLAPQTRSDPQNKKLHAMLGDISKQIEWAGSKRDIEVWKRLIVAAWTRARGESVEILPALDGKGIDVVFRRTSKLNKGEMAELIEFVMAWGAQAGVEWSE